MSIAIKLSEPSTDREGVERRASERRSVEPTLHTPRSTLRRSTLSRSTLPSMAKPINFFCFAPAAKSVLLIGDFNHWNPTANPMQRRPDGWWSLQVPLTHGHHQYQFLVDGTPTLDPYATGVTRNERYAQVSLIAVS